MRAHVEKVDVLVWNKSCATSSKEQTGNIIMFAQFEEGGLLSETCEYSEGDDKSGDESNNDSIMPPVLNLEETDALDSGCESYYEAMSKEKLEDIRDGIQSHPGVNSIDAHYKIRDRIKQR